MGQNKKRDNYLDDFIDHQNNYRGAPGKYSGGNFPLPVKYPNKIAIISTLAYSILAMLFAALFFFGAEATYDKFKISLIFVFFLIMTIGLILRLKNK